ncbi:MAG TPA: hypothetical protein VGG26_11190 [Terracidiphilus sp.]|jgi:hypothetical protein
MSAAPSAPTRTHTYHGEATVLKGDLYHPLVQQIKPQSNVKLADHGGYLSEHSEPYRLEGVIAFEKAYTQVAGNPNPKPEGGWTTLVTSVIEDLNVLEVVTADRVIGQIATVHPAQGYVPQVHFLGTRFENLRIDGRPVDVHFHRDHPYPMPDPVNDGPYTRHPGFLDRLKTQFESMRGSTGVSDELLKRYSHLPSKSGTEDEGTSEESVELSLVEKVDAPSFCRCHGHVIYLKDFGEIHLGVLKVHHSDYNKQKGLYKRTLFELTMIELKMGCVAGGMSAMGIAITNGQSSP